MSLLHHHTTNLVHLTQFFIAIVMDGTPTYLFTHHLSVSLPITHFRNTLHWMIPQADIPSFPSQPLPF